MNKESGYVKGPFFIHRKTNHGVLSLFCCTLRRSHPELKGMGYEVLATATSREDWFSLVRDTFFMPLEDLSEEDRDLLWTQVSADHAKWAANQKPEGPA